MRNFFAAIFRNTIFPIVSVPMTYYPGMVLLRLARKARELSYRTDAKEEMKTVPFAGNLKMKVDINSYMGGSIFWAGLHHLNEILYLNSILSDGMTFIDVGANQGEFSIFASSRMPHGRVLAFEPVNKIRDLLLENKQLNHFDHLEVYDYGLSDKEGSFPIYTSIDTTLHHGYHEGLSTLFKTSERNVLEQEVNLKVFDEQFFEKLERIDFVKIDVEGAELFVLKGMYKSLIKFKPPLLIEINDDTFSAAGYTITELMTFLSALNYESFKIRKGKLQSIQSPDMNSWGNYIFRARS